MVDIQTNANIIYIVATGKLDDADYDKMLPILRQKIEKYEKINWFFQMKDFEGWTPHAFWRDIKFDFKNTDKLNKVAIVGEKKWHELMTKAMKPFTSAKIKYFDEENASTAKDWISKPKD
jgi:SpoIIAA-like